MTLQVTAIMIGVEDIARSRKFHGEGLGRTIEQDHPNFGAFNPGDGSSSLSLYEWEAEAQDSGVSSEGPASGVCRSITLSHRAKLRTRS